MIEVHRLPQGTGGFERVPNQAVRNVELSLAAVGLLNRLLTDGKQYGSIDEIAAAYNPAGPGRRAPFGFGRDVYRKAAAELQAAGHIRHSKGASKGFGKPPENIVEVSAVPFAQVISGRGQSAAGNYLGEYDSEQSADAQTASTQAPSCATNTQVNSDSGQYAARNDLGGRTRKAESVTLKVPLTSGNGAMLQVISDDGLSASRSAPSVTCVDSANPQVISDDGLSASAPLYTDLPPDPPTPAGRPGSAMGEEGGTAAPGNPADARARLAEEAHVILDGLPQERKTNSRDRAKVVPAIVDRLELGWPAAALAAYLAEPELPKRRVSLGGLMVGWLPPQRPYRPPAAPSQPSTSLPDWCGHCGGPDDALPRANAIFRTTDGEPESPLCPDCHPSMIGVKP